MAFLDNSGDIILDAVLTDTGRQRLARGDGTFRVAKFALGDDEINYALYNPSHTSGSAYYDLDILQTPVLEAFTNNMSSMKSKLMSISNTNLLYLPVMKLFNKVSGGELYNTFDSATGNFNNGSAQTDLDIHLVAVNLDTVTNICTDAANNAGQQLPYGILNGYTPNDSGNGSYEGKNKIRIDQGMDSINLPTNVQIAASLLETQYIIEMDNRLGVLYSPAGQTIATPSFIDDDNIASYFVTTATTGFVKMLVANNVSTESVLLGSRGTKLEFKIKATVNVENSDYLFAQMGLSSPIYLAANEASSYNAIDSIIRITGATTGYTIEIPVRYIRYVS